MERGTSMLYPTGSPYLNWWHNEVWALGTIWTFKRTTERWRSFFESSYSARLILFWNDLSCLYFSSRMWLIRTNSSLLPLTLKVMPIWLSKLSQASKEILFSDIESIPAHLFPWKTFGTFILNTTEELYLSWPSFSWNHRFHPPICWRLQLCQHLHHWLLLNSFGLRQKNLK